MSVISLYSRESIESTLVEIAEDLIQDWGLDLDEKVSGKTLLVHDLEFASVDIIQLCVAIDEHYDKKIGFQDLLMKEGSYVSDLSISEVTDFVKNKINNEGNKK